MSEIATSSVYGLSGNYWNLKPDITDIIPYNSNLYLVSECKTRKSTRNYVPEIAVEVLSPNPTSVSINIALWIGFGVLAGIVLIGTLIVVNWKIDIYCITIVDYAYYI